MTINQQTGLYGVLGFPLTHTLSPVMHNAALTALGLNDVYLALETKDITAAMTGVRALGIKGLSVTIPYKSEVIPLLDEVDSLATNIGAVNTIVNREGRLLGYNTDAWGALAALEEVISIGHRTRCLVIGAGGAARAVGFALQTKGAGVIIVNRSPDKGQALARDLNCDFLPWAEEDRAEAEVIIQTTPVGMYPDIDNCPVPESVLRPGLTVMDIIYNPWETKLLGLAKSRGCRVINGLPMFIHQGGAQLRLWTDLEPPLALMRATVEAALGVGRH
ncbi:MAG: shikimate dehydrogenase [Deltaproteobacteria bacterium]|nr:shikimate dehydrogenase [Deltaproteobacteria bacterium]